MYQKTLKTVLVTSLLCGALTLGVYASKYQNYEIEPAFAYTNGDGATYYNSISDTLTGTALVTELNKLNTNKLKSRVGYGSMPSNFKYTDYDPDKGYGSTTLLSFYSGKSAVYSGNMNREHTWPASRTVGGRNNDPLEDDIHMTRPTLSSENSSRGNSFFAESGAWDPATFNNPSYRGDAARIIMYCAIADTRLKLVDSTNDSTGNHSMGKLSDLLKWNLQYPVQQREKNRNEGAEGLQGNRNPFIDHPEYGCRIWGNTNDETRKICAGSTPDPTPTPTPEPPEPKAPTATLSSTEMTVNEGVAASISVDIETYDEELISTVWKSSDESVVTIEDGQYITVGPGTATITVTVTTEAGSVSVSCVITVTAKPKPTTTGCTGSVIATSVLISTSSLVGFTLLAIRRRKKEK